MSHKTFWDPRSPPGTTLSAKAKDSWPGNLCSYRGPGVTPHSPPHLTPCAVQEALQVPKAPLDSCHVPG